MVHFLDAAAGAGTGEALNAYTGPERLHLDRDHVYIDYGAGLARSKLTPNALEKMVKASGTSRNWNTTVKLLELARAREA